MARSTAIWYVGFTDGYDVHFPFTAFTVKRKLIEFLVKDEIAGDNYEIWRIPDGGSKTRNPESYVWDWETRVLRIDPIQITSYYEKGSL
jgi:hypothetical protein